MGMILGKIRAAWNAVLAARINLPRLHEGGKQETGFHRGDREKRALAVRFTPEIALGR
jgi:hypothetical protein